VASGEAFSTGQVEEVRRALAVANSTTGLSFSAYVGDAAPGTPNDRAYAERLLGAMPDPPVSVLVFVNPAGRRVEIVTGREAGMRLEDRACAMAAVAMTSTFALGDLAGGISRGLLLMAQNATPEAIVR
jgi:hypothetical protein